MKKKGLILLLIISLFSFHACDEDSGEKITNVLTASMTAEVDGVEWKAVTRVTVLEMGKFNISGTSLDGKLINITSFSDEAKEYLLDPPTIQFSAVFNPNATQPSTDNYIAATGNLNITSINTDKKTISGTFTFEGIKNLTESVSVTNGIFTNLSYQEK